MVSGTASVVLINEWYRLEPEILTLECLGKHCRSDQTAPKRSSLIRSAMFAVSLAVFHTLTPDRIHYLVKL